MDKNTQTTLDAQEVPVSAQDAALDAAILEATEPQVITATVVPTIDTNSGYSNVEINIPGYSTLFLCVLLAKDALEIAHRINFHNPETPEVAA